MMSFYDTVIKPIEEELKENNVIIVDPKQEILHRSFAQNDNLCNAQQPKDVLLGKCSNMSVNDRPICSKAFIDDRNRVVCSKK